MSNFDATLYIDVAQIDIKGTSKNRRERADRVLRSARVRKYAEHRKCQSGA